MKAISAVIAIVLILMITVSLAAVGYMWTTGMFEELSETGSEQTETLITKGQAQFEIDSLTISEIYLRNTGQVALSGFLLYVDDKVSEFAIDKETLEKNEINIIYLVYELSPGDKIKVTTAEGAVVEKTLTEPSEATVLGGSYGGGSGGGVGGTYAIEGAIESVCGNGAIGGTEECDDGNTVSDDGCSNECIIELLTIELTLDGLCPRSYSTPCSDDCGAICTNESNDCQNTCDNEYDACYSQCDGNSYCEVECENIFLDCHSECWNNIMNCGDNCDTVCSSCYLCDPLIPCEIGATITDGVEPYTYEWDIINDNIYSGNPITITDMSSSFYEATLTVGDSQGRQSSIDFGIVNVYVG